ncbi:MAG: MarC family protein [Thermoprotei archaeon]|nr:MAG: MarC family protein [Thermoprotei archaeon]
MLQYLLDLAVYFVQIYAIMDPPGVLPMFISLTENLSKRERNKIVFRSTIVILLLVTVFTLMGDYVLMFFDISVSSLQIGGGILLLIISAEMLGGPPRARAVEPEDIAVVPIATPLIVGPGTMTTLILLTTRNSSPMNTAIVLMAAYLAVLATYLTLRFGERLVEVLKPSVVRAVGRFMSVIVAAIAAEMIMRGVSDWYKIVVES